MTTYISGKETLEKTGQKVATEQRRYAIDPKVYLHDWVVDAGASVFALQGPAGSPKKRSIDDVLIRCFEEEAFGEWCYLSAQLAAAATTINIDDGAASAPGFIVPMDVLQLMKADLTETEVVLVTAVASNGLSATIEIWTS